MDLLDLPQESSIYSFLDEFENEDEDDGFYGELKKQVMQLTADDEDEDIDENKNPNTVAAKRVPSCVRLQRHDYYNWPGNKDEDSSAPSWVLKLWRTGNGTGVFIPQIAPSRRRNRSRKRRGKKGRTQPDME